MAVGEISAVTVTEGMMSDAMDVSGYFSDADMDTLTYSAASSDDMVATASVDGSMVTITGVAAGIGHHYGDRHRRGRRIRHADHRGNRRSGQHASHGCWRRLSAVTVTAKAMMSDAMDVSGYFSDADMGDTLTYSAASERRIWYATADIPVDGSMVTITGVAAGIGHHYGDRHRRGRRIRHADHHGYRRSGGHDTELTEQRHGHD